MSYVYFIELLLDFFGLGDFATRGEIFIWVKYVFGLLTLSEFWN